jgi:hypothetical protein
MKAIRRTILLTTILAAAAASNIPAMAEEPSPSQEGASATQERRSARRSAERKIEPAKSFRSSQLQTGSLQPAAPMDSHARGLTPESEWRKMFPRKPGQENNAR